MPNYTDTAAAHRAGKGQAKAVEDPIRQRKNIGRGYQIQTSFNGAKAVLVISGPHNQIERMPADIVIEYARVLDLIEQWHNDQLADFPVL